MMRRKEKGEEGKKEERKIRRDESVLERNEVRRRGERRGEERGRERREEKKRKKEEERRGERGRGEH